MGRLLSLLMAFVFLGQYNAHAQSVTCEPNTDFELGNYSYWSFFQGTCCSPFSMTTAVTPPTARESLTSGTGLDPYGGFPIVAPGGNYSLKLGTNDMNYLSDRVRYKVHVPVGLSNYALIYRYAIVMQDPGHVAAQQPRFTVSTIDSNTGNLVPCSQFTYVAGSLPGFSVSSVSSSVFYKPWSSAIINLSGYAGHTILIDFARGDCGLGGHFGYGYVDMSCGLFAISLNSCYTPGGTTTLTGPPGFKSYRWMDSTYTTVIDSGQIVNIATPPSSRTYRLIITPYPGYGCADTLSARVLVSNFSVATRDTTLCTGQTLSLTPSISGAVGTVNYSWTPSTGLSCTSCLTPSLTTSISRKYYITATDSSGCAKTDSINITVRPLPNVVAPDKTICTGSATTLNASGASSYSWSPSTGLSCTSCANPIANSITTTTYVVTGIDSNGCINRDTVIVTVKPLPNVVAPDKTICIGSATTLNASGSSSYSWSPSTGLSCTACTSPTANPTVTTTYVVTGTDSNACVNSDSVIVKVNPLPNVVAPDKTICIGSSTTLNATGASTYSWSPSTGLSCTACASPNANPTVTTTYIVTGTDSNGCVNRDTVIVKVNPLPNVVAPDKTICIGSATSLNASGASSYSWSPSTGLSCTACPSPTANPTATTTYIVTGTDSNGCVNRDTVNVKVNPLPNVVAPDKTICIGSSTTLNATGASSYSWSPSTGLSCTACASPNANPTVTTTYIVTGTDTNGCVNRDTVIVKINPLPNVVAPDKTICIGSTTTLNASGANTYSWSPSTGLSCTACASPNANPTVTTTYIVTGTDSNGCVNRDTVIVKINPLPNVVTPDKTICIGSATSLNASGASSYSWSPSTGLSCTACASPTANPTVTTTYVVIGTDTNACVNRDTVIVKVNPLPTINTSNKTICLNDTVALAATGATTYTWSPSTTLSCSTCPNPKAYPKTTTVYTIIGKDSNTCINSITCTVSVNTLPKISANDQTICLGDSANLLASGARSISWSPRIGIACPDCASTKVAPKTTSTYTITAVDSNGCMSKDSISVLVQALPIVEGSNQVVCKGFATTISASGATFYHWSPSAGLACDTCTTTKATPDSSTTYWVSGIDSNGCVNRDSVRITVFVPLQLLADTAPAICKGDTAMLRVSGSKYYTWSPNASLACSTCDSTKAFPSSTSNYTVIATDSNNCKDTATINLIVNPLPVLNTNKDTQICDGKSIRLSVSGAKEYTWKPASSLSCSTCDTTTASPNNDTKYTVIGLDAQGCKDSTTINISLLKRKPISYSLADSLCAGASIQLHANGGTSYLWIPATGLNNDSLAEPICTPTNSGNYKVIIKQGNCFVDTGIVNLVVYPIPSISVSGDTLIYKGEKAHLYSTGTNVLQYKWTPNEHLDCPTCPNPIASVDETTTFLLVVKGAGDCENQDTITVKVKCDQSKVFIPNTFTPNGDGENDRFYPMGSGVQSIIDFMIYNRWGELVYEKHHFGLNNPADGWDGIYNCKALAPDVFIYYIHATCDGGDIIQLKGDISLVK
jgi:gliding motility-associated-like protein